ncbi:MAG: bacteriohemerythrin [Candidatus Saccharibacteria bacterium]
MIKWDDKYSIGVAQIDEQHKKLFEIANRAFELLKNDLITDKFDQIATVLDELKEYTIYHFKTEEEYMKSVKYMRFLGHKVIHDDFVKKLEDTDYRSIDENQDRYISELLEFLVNWISQHILKEDKQITA